VASTPEMLNINKRRLNSRSSSRLRIRSVSGRRAIELDFSRFAFCSPAENAGVEHSENIPK
jgi:hypothetical protein